MLSHKIDSLPRVLIVAPRYPWPPYTGDRARANLWLEALAERAEIVLITTDGERPTNGVSVIEARPSLRALVRAIPRVVRERLPLHTLDVARYDWRAAIRAAGAVDCAIVILSRTDPWVIASLEAKRLVLDAIDSATEGMRERAAASRDPLTRTFWSIEASRMERLERDAGARYDQVVVVSQDEEHPFGAGAITVPMGVDVVDNSNEPRRFEFGFWGHLGYFANDRAAQSLVRTIWPAIRRRKPRATLFIGGAGAPSWLRARHGRDGITVVSPGNDRAGALRNIRIALLPILFGTGQSMKTLEAAEAECAIIGTSAAFRAMPDLAAAGIIEDRLERFADAAVALLEDPERCRAAGAALREIVAANHSRETSRVQLAALALGASVSS